MTVDSSWREPSRRLRLAGWFFGLLALAAVIALAAHVGDVERFLRLLRSLAPGWLLLALLLQAGTYCSTAIAWRLGLRQAGSDLPLRGLLPLALAKLFVDQAIPSGGMSGTGFLVAALTRRRVQGSVCMSVLLVNLVGHFGAYVMAALAAIVVLWLAHTVESWMVGVTTLFVLVSLSIPICALSLHRIGHREPPWLRRIPGVAPLLDAFADAPLTLLRRPRLVMAMTALSIAVVVFDSTTLWVMLHAIGQSVPYRFVFPSFVLAMMVAMLGPIPLGLGTFEATSTASLVLLGVPIEAALTGTLLLRGCTTWLPMVPGMILVRRELQAGKGSTRERSSSRA